MGSFGPALGANFLGTALGGTVAVPPGMILYDLAKTKLLKQKATAPNYMGDEFKKEVVAKGVAEGLKIHQIKNLKWGAALYAASTAMMLAPVVARILKKKSNASRQQIASKVQHVGEQAANNLKEVTHQSALVITPEQK